MFTKIGESKWMKLVLFITTFAFVGTALVALIVYKMSGKISGAAEVNGREISMQRFMYEVNLIQNNLERQGIDIAPLRKAIQKQALNNIINEELIYQEAEKEGIVATKEEVKEAILDIPAFQENGVFSKDRYLAIINSMGISPQFFEEIIRRQITRDHILAIIDGAAYLTEDEVRPFLNKELTTITGKVLIIKPEISISEKELRQFYEKNPDLFTGKKGKKIVVYEINIKQVGKEKAANLAKDIFLKLKNNQPVEIKEGIKKVFDDVFYKKEQLKNLPEEVVSDLESLSKEKNISFIKTKDAYYLAKFEKEVSKPMAYEKVKEKVKEYLKRKKMQEELKKMYKEIKEAIKNNVSLKELSKRYRGKTESIKDLTLRDIAQKYLVYVEDLVDLLKVKEGNLSSPVETKDSILVFKIEKKGLKKEKEKGLENLIKDVIYDQKVNDLFNSYIIKLRESAEIKINPRLLE